MPKVIDVDRLFQTVVLVFAENGYVLTTTQEIADRAGIHEVTLFRRYQNKAALIEAALSHCLANSPFGHLVATEDVRVDLLAIVKAYEKTYRAYGGAVLTLLNEIPRHRELRKVLAVLMPNLRNAAKIIAIHQKRGSLGPGNPPQKVAMLIAPVLASGLWARTGATKDIPLPHAADIVDRFLDGHRASVVPRQLRSFRPSGL